MTRLLHRAARAAWVVALAGVFAAPAAFARDAFVLLSGGVSPINNNYSQYLQARAMTYYFQSHYPSNSVWVFFGAGNVAGERPVLSDVYLEKQQDGGSFPWWEPGALPRNLPARRAVFLQKLRDEILPAVAGGGTLFLFVGDHGSRSEGKNSESEIDLWGLTPDSKNDHGWSLDENEILRVSDLRSALTNGLGKGRVVFCMTQCHSGGFHYLGIPHEATPDGQWFTRAPKYALAAGQPVPPQIAGFAATDEYSLAAGCDPAPDAEHWAGYERFVPEALMGINLYTGKSASRPVHSFAAAHDAAVPRDITIDRPASTSEQYLERWSRLIETRLAKERHLKANVRAAVAAYQHAVDGEPFAAMDPALADRQRQYQQFKQAMTGANYDLLAVLTGGKCAELERRLNADTEDPPADEKTERRDVRLWRNTIRPAWQAAVKANQMPDVGRTALEFERRLLALEDKGDNTFNGPEAADTLQVAAYWEAGFGDPQNLKAARAEAITRWAAQRHDKILAWAKASAQSAVRRAAERLAKDEGQGASDDEDASRIDEGTAIARTLFYRRVLAAWQFLLTVNDRPALDRLRQLAELERTPLP